MGDRYIFTNEHFLYTWKSPYLSGVDWLCVAFRDLHRPKRHTWGWRVLSNRKGLLEFWGFEVKGKLARKARRGKQVTFWKEKWVFRARTGDEKVCDDVCMGMSDVSISFWGQKLPWRRDLGGGF